MNPDTFIKINDSNDNLIYSTFPKSCTQSCNFDVCDSSKIASCTLHRTKKRVGLIKTDSGIVKICSSEETHLNSSKLFRKLLSIYAAFCKDFCNAKIKITDSVNAHTKRLLHNLTSLNGKNIQDVYALIPQDILTNRLDAQIETIKQIIIADPDAVARTLLKIAKNNSSIKTEFSVFRKLYETSPVLNLKSHPIRSVVLNTCHVFFEDFTDKHVYVKVHDFNARVLIDYESIHVVLYHLIDNASKYIQPDSLFDIVFSETQEEVKLYLKMMSLRISPMDLLKMFDDEYSSPIAKIEKLAGHGFGMGIIKSLLSLNKASITIKPNLHPSKNITVRNIPYEYNVFEITFIKSS